ncbi:DUF503 domain-containing protein [Lihuaxuella thermophila]|uniref:YlxP-like protein n=1 Tax=Lihuaxuella thermophila TaxID=1173111 RepID=A0A1H8GKP7_9BACL|nr:DUF503 domain-containing protein [Lihuaxuella thermophila]SEN44711.1 hypothetical protein SAMN05444955_111120 [Lihuaxuella thermophila]
MYVGVQEVTGRVIGSSSLKDKRRVIQSGLTRIKNKFNLSVAEVGHQDDRQWTTLAMAGVGSDKSIVEKELRGALRLLEETDGLMILDTDVTFV